MFKGLKDIYIQKNTIDGDSSSLRVFAIFNDLIVQHEIQGELAKWGPEEKMMTKQEYSLLKDLIKDKHGLAIDEMGIKYKQYGADYQKNHIAVAAVATHGNGRQIIEPYSSKKVVRHCEGLQRRRKRVSAPSIICPRRKKSQPEDKRTTYQELETRFAKKHPRFHRRVEKIYKIATRIQTSIIGGSMLSHLLQGDFKAFGIDVAFLGAAVASPYAAERIAKWAYQLHQEIKNNDTVSAAITGASLAIDIIGCGFEAAAAVGLLAISPIIVKRRIGLCWLQLPEWMVKLVKMDERLDVIEEDEEEEKVWAEYRKQMDLLEDLLPLRP
uniref:Uncharacterized protein n=1 Tax=Romanomermis culicivorax TaxID=13658 RepID=A0A915HTH5_ROMCU